MWSTKNKRSAFTMLEIVVSIVLLTIGALGYAVVTAAFARAFLLDSHRARAGEISESQREVLLRQGCTAATSGSALRFGMGVDWSVSPPAPSTRTMLVVVTRPAAAASAHDSLSALIPCG
jgi:prepilin-type N-terminal cleavage/methylation domain-containing protein